jgi:Domain of unknown function (DUF5666)
MRIPRWRIALTGGAIVVLMAAGIGLATASTTNPPTVGLAAAPAPTASAPAAAGPAARGLGQRLQNLGQRLQNLGQRLATGARIGRNVVHGVVTVQDKDGNLITIQVDHGTIASIGSGSITIDEAGGSSVTVTTDSNTLVRIDGQKASLDDLKSGDQVYVQSRLDNGTALAKHILEPKAASGS